jgi:hypothetical protein
VQLLSNWYSQEEADKKGIVLVVTASKEGAIVGGLDFLDAIGDDLVDSIAGDQIPIYTEQVRACVRGEGGGGVADRVKFGALRGGGGGGVDGGKACKLN